MRSSCDGASSSAPSPRAAGPAGGTRAVPAYSTTIAGPTRARPLGEVLAREDGDVDLAGVGWTRCRASGSGIRWRRAPRPPWEDPAARRVARTRAGDDLDGVVLQPPAEARLVGLVEGLLEVLRVSGHAEVVGLAPVAKAKLDSTSTEPGPPQAPRSPPRPAWRRVPRARPGRSRRRASGRSVIDRRPRRLAIPAADSTPAATAGRARHAERAGEVSAGQSTTAAEGGQRSRAGRGLAAWSSRRAPAAWTRSRSRRPRGGAHAVGAEGSPRASKARSAAATSRLTPPRNPRSSGAWDAPEDHVGVGDGRDRAAAAEGDRAGVRPALSGPTRRDPAASTRARLPPPQPIVCMSSVGTAIAWPATTSSPRAPSPRAGSWNHVGAVPPMSSVAIAACPAAAAAGPLRRRPPRVRRAGPARARAPRGRRRGCRPSSRGRRAAPRRAPRRGVRGSAGPPGRGRRCRAPSRSARLRDTRRRGPRTPSRPPRARSASATRRSGPGSPAVEQADRSAPRPAGHDRVGHAGDLLVGGAPLLDEGPGLDPDGPLAELEAELAGCEGRGPDGLEGVQVRARLAVDLHEVLEALVGDDGDVGRGSLEEGVEGHRRPVDHLHAGALLRRQPERIEALEQGAPRVVWGRTHLHDAGRRVRALEHDVRERAARVDAHAQGAAVRGCCAEAPGGGRAGGAGHGAECTPARGSAADRRGFAPATGGRSCRMRAHERTEP